MFFIFGVELINFLEYDHTRIRFSILLELRCKGKGVVKRLIVWLGLRVAC